MEDDTELEWMATTPVPDADSAASSLRSFLRLPASQRSAVILKDVLDHSLEEAAAIMGLSEAAVKSALQRGRERLRMLAKDPADPAATPLDDATRKRLAAYVEGVRTLHGGGAPRDAGL